MSDFPDATEMDSWDRDRIMQEADEVMTGLGEQDDEKSAFTANIIYYLLREIDEDRGAIKTAARRKKALDAIRSADLQQHIHRLLAHTYEDVFTRAAADAAATHVAERIMIIIDRHIRSAGEAA